MTLPTTSISTFCAKTRMKTGKGVSGAHLMNNTSVADLLVAAINTIPRRYIFFDPNRDWAQPLNKRPQMAPACCPLLMPDCQAGEMVLTPVAGSSSPNR